MTAINAEILKKRTFDFALATFRAIDRLEKSTVNEVMGKQVIRSSSSVGAKALGFKLFDPGVEIKGIILNRIADENHLNSIKRAIDKRVGIPVLGGIPRVKDIELEERHLGLIPSGEKKVPKERLEKISEIIKKHVDLERLLKISKSSSHIPNFKRSLFVDDPLKETTARLGVARDEAFSFYYEDVFDVMRHRGCEIVEFSPTRDTELPDNLDAIYIGGGFPEFFGRELSENESMKKSIREFHKIGKPVYAECGGLMYLCRAIKDVEGQEFKMVGIVPGKTVMTPKLQALSYVEMEASKDGAFFKRGDKLRGHEFHFSILEVEEELNFVLKTVSTTGKVKPEGIISKNTLASYTHFHLASNPEVVREIPVRLVKN